MKARIVFLSVVFGLILMVGCTFKKEVVVSPEQLEKLDSFESYRCPTNLFIVFYKKYRIDNNKNDDAFYLNKDGELCFIKGQTSRGSWGRIRDKEIIAEKTSELKELVRADIDMIDNEKDVEKIIADLSPLNLSFIEEILKEPRILSDGSSVKYYEDLWIRIDSSSIFCLYQYENLLNYISFDREGNIKDFCFSNFGCVTSDMKLDSLAYEYPEKEFYYFSAGMSFLWYINKERVVISDYVHCLPSEDVENLRWKIESILMSIKMDLILQ
ncbi:MAG TPA: hypothetical protein PK142_01035 [bacterium]|nr:hypothetical protein [bacterium]